MSSEAQRAANRKYMARIRAEQPFTQGEREREYARRRREEKPDTIRGYDLKAKYGMTMGDLLAMRASQDGKCAICVRVMRTVGPSGFDREYVDHCHATGRVRGLLCGRCNTSIGHFNDDPVLLMAAARYVEQPSQ